MDKMYPFCFGFKAATLSLRIMKPEDESASCAGLISQVGGGTVPSPLIETIPVSFISFEDKWVGMGGEVLSWVHIGAVSA